MHIVEHRVPTHPNLAKFREHRVAERVYPNLRRVVARGRELRDRLRRRGRTLDDDALGSDLVDLFGRVRAELVAELLREVVSALVLELGVPRDLRRLLGRAVRLHLIHDHREDVDNGCEFLRRERRERLRVTRR